MAIALFYVPFALLQGIILVVNTTLTQLSVRLAIPEQRAVNSLCILLQLVDSFRTTRYKNSIINDVILLPGQFLPFDWLRAEVLQQRAVKAEGGKFIMYPASVSGQFQNNKVQE